MQNSRKPSPGTSYTTTSDHVKFWNVSTRWRQIMAVPEYRFDDMRPDDIVIDIGANVGAFAIRAARISHRVVAVEPVTCDLLQENIRLNGVDVRVICGALGDGGPAEVRWDGEAVTTPTFPLGKIIAMAGGCDFLKCDCEGTEWHIDPADLLPVRRIEMELHLPPISGKPNPVLLDAISRQYEFTLDKQPCHGPLGLMGYLNAYRFNNHPGGI